MRKEAVYGFPCVQDPHDFTPDAECCSPKELEAHRLACETYGTTSYQPNDGCEWLVDERGKPLAHVAKTSWGIGVNMVEMDEKDQ